MTLSFFIILSSILTPLLVDRTGATGTFLFYGIACILGLLHLCIFLKDTTYKEDGKTKLSEKEKKELYIPEEYKDK